MRRRGAVASIVGFVLAITLAANTSAAPPGARLGIGTTFAGMSGANFVPSQVTGAIGTTRYVQMVNGRGRIFDRAGAIRASFTLEALVGAETGEWVVEPQVMWDAQTYRFYYALVWSDFSTNVHRVAFGFSRTASPDDATDFCGYLRPFGNRTVVDLSLGDSRDFILMGINTYDGATGMILRADVVHFDKPGPGAACPPAASLDIGVRPNIRGPGGSALSSPVAVQQTDPAATGWIVSIPVIPAGGSADRLFLHRVTTGPSGDPVIPANGVAVDVAAFRVPPPADQKDQTRDLRTGDASLSQAVSAVDPLRGGHAIWTAHAVKAGSWSVVRWYEIDPTAEELHQNGTVGFDDGFAFTPGISPDRHVNGATRRFGSNMVLTYGTSSATTYQAIRLVAKRGNQALSPSVLLVMSPGPHADFSCFGSTDACFWGADGAASPDPIVPPSATVGRVWVANQYSNGAGTTSGPNWRTRIAAVTP